MDQAQELENKIALLKDSFGPELLEAMSDPDVVEVMLNPDGKLWIDYLSKGTELTKIRIPPERARALISTVAGTTGKTVSAKEPDVATTVLIDGSRFQGLLPPIVESPSFTIRKRASKIFTLDDYVAQGNLTERQRDILVQGIKEKKNILVAGGTGSGKTTFTNALLQIISGIGQRVILLEDTKELQCSAEDKVEMLTSPTRNMQALVRFVLRYRPDRTVVGEVRGGEALDLLKLWNTGHPGGLATLHADSTLQTLERLEDLISEVSANIPNRLIYRAIDMVVYMERYRNMRRIKEISEVTGYEGGSYKLIEIK